MNKIEVNRYYFSSSSIILTLILCFLNTILCAQDFQSKVASHWKYNTTTKTYSFDSSFDKFLDENANELKTLRPEQLQSCFGIASEVIDLKDEYKLPNESILRYYIEHDYTTKESSRTYNFKFDKNSRLIGWTENMSYTIGCGGPHIDTRSKYNLLPVDVRRADGCKPIPQGGERGLYDYLHEATNKKLKKRNLKLNENLYVSFIVTSLGKVEDSRIERPGKTIELNKMALDIINKMPNWTPATFNGEKYDYEYTMPMRFNNLK